MSILISFLIGVVVGAMSIICIALIVGGSNEDTDIDRR